MSLTCHQFESHKLKWSLGDYWFMEAMDDIFAKVGSNKVYVKGLEKFAYLSRWIPNVIEIDWLPSFSTMNECRNEVCSVKHELYCARRKVHELQRADAASR
jgi:hypothetical protein